MHNDTIKVANKIIMDNVLLDIFQRMNEELEKCKKAYENEKLQNEKYEWAYQKWSVKDFSGSFNCRFNFYDDTEIEIDNYNTFIGIFNNRIHEIKNMWVRYYFSYGIGNGTNIKYIRKHINMDIYENRMSIDVDINSDDDKMQGVYNFIKERIMRAPEKYDRVIKNKTSIMNKVAISIGLIPSTIICLLTLISPEIRMFFGNTYVVFPIVVLILGYFIGFVFSSGKLYDLYTPILPEKKYVGYDTVNYKSIYKDDIDKYVETSEIIIGKNVNNIRNRRKILEIERKYSKFIPIELVMLMGISIIVIIIGKLI